MKLQIRNCKQSVAAIYDRRLVVVIASAFLMTSLSAFAATTLRVEPYTLPAADVGPENPLPMFRGDKEDDVPQLDPAMPEDDRRYLGWRTMWRCLPHRMQDGYNREKRS